MLTEDQVHEIWRRGIMNVRGDAPQEDKFGLQVFWGEKIVHKGARTVYLGERENPSHLTVLDFETGRALIIGVEHAPDYPRTHYYFVDVGGGGKYGKVSYSRHLFNPDATRHIERIKKTLSEVK